MRLCLCCGTFIREDEDDTSTEAQLNAEDTAGLDLSGDFDETDILLALLRILNEGR